MNEAWRKFLEAQGARLDEKGFAHFDRRAADCACMDLSWLGLIRVAGGDAASFLQGQVTNDTRRIDEGHAALGGYCTPKGRMLSLFRMFQRDDAIYLLLPAERLEATIQRLKIFVLMSDVQLSDASDELVRVGLAGECAPALLAAKSGEAPSAMNQVMIHGDLTLIRVEGEMPRFLVVGPVEAMQSLWGRLAKRAEPVDSAYWRLLDIRAGVPSVWEATAEAFVPQMANLQLIDGVSFTKGCYTGQEVVARMQYLGKLKRRMYPGTIAIDEAPPPGTSLYSEASQSAQGSGKVVDAVGNENGQVEALVVAEIQAAESGPLHVGSEQDVTIELREPPYGFKSEEEQGKDS